jgi:hypothetical protein
MHQNFAAALRWLRSLWSDSSDPSTQAYRRHVRGILTGWGITASAMALIGLYPDSASMTMYQTLLTDGLPWQQQGLAALEIAGPLVMMWHLLSLKRFSAALSRE